EETPVEAVEETPAEPVEEAPVEAVEAPAESVATPTEPVATPAELVATPTEAVEMEAEDDESEQSESSYYMEEVKKPIRKKNDFSRFIAAALIVSVAGGASMGAGYAYVKYNMETPEAVTKVPIVAQPVVSQSQGQSQSQSYSAVEVIKAVKPTVVSISTETVGETQYFGAFTIPYEEQSAGSGVVFFSDNDRVAIATNNHVIEGTTEIFVTFDEDITVPAKVVGTKSDSDLAVIVVNWDDLEEQGMYDVSVAAFGDSDLLEVGAPVFAIGNAMGEGISATDGIISMTEQTIIIDESQLTVLQTSAAINGGNSGGALVNTAGEVIGINTAKYNPNQAEGMGYAIPSNEFVTIIEDLLLNGTMPKPYIGVTGTSITADNAVLYRLPVGALIMEVVEGGPADLAGIKVGDIVTQVNGGTVMDMESLITIVNELEVGTEVDIHVVRDTSESVDLKLIVGDKNS
ncbi:MAG: trypsin-like peptidase domain-containing protein, partial [Bacillota bacterium]